MKRRQLRIVLKISLFLLLISQDATTGYPARKDKESAPEAVSISRYSIKCTSPVKNFKTLNLREKRADNQPSGIGGFFQTAAQDAVSSTSAFTSPTMFVGGFSMMMQPMPNGTEFAGQLVNAVPHYANFLPSFPGLPGASRQEAPEKSPSTK